MNLAQNNGAAGASLGNKFPRPDRQSPFQFALSFDLGRIDTRQANLGIDILAQPYAGANDNGIAVNHPEHTGLNRPRHGFRAVGRKNRNRNPGE